MAYDNIYVKGSTGVIEQVRIVDSSTGMGKTGLNNTNVTAYYCRPGGTSTQIPLISGSPGDSYSSGKFAEIDSTYMRGEYQIHLPAGCLLTGANKCSISFQGTGAMDTPLKLALIDADLRNAANLGLSDISNVLIGLIGGEATVNAAGTVIGLYTKAGVLYVTLTATTDGGGNVTWTPVFA